MAHLIKSTRGATGGLTRHFERLIYMVQNYIKDAEYLKNENLKEKEQKFSLEDLSKEDKTKSKIYKLENKVDKLSNFIIEKGLTDEFNRSVKVLYKDHGLER